MNILVLNSGSSSIKYKLFEDLIETDSGMREEVEDFDTEIKAIIAAYEHKGVKIDGVGHRVVHGGEKFNQAVLIDQDVIDTIRELIPLAPLHNPSNLKAIEILVKAHPDLAQVAVFDTAFHQTIPPENYLYPLPMLLYQKEHIRKYGFHGTSVEYLTKAYAKFMHQKVEDTTIIVAHLGNGASITLVKNGKSFDTSMGFTPLEGLMMGTRCGSIDPSIVIYLQEHYGMSSREVDSLLNKQSGLKGICGHSDMREVLEGGHALAFEMFCNRVRKTIGAFMVQAEQVDAVVFSGGIGEHVSEVREKVMEGIALPYLTIPTNEELEIAEQTYLLIKTCV
jgi:acetate kinase